MVLYPIGSHLCDVLLLEITRVDHDIHVGTGVVANLNALYSIHIGMEISDTIRLNNL